MSSDFTVSTATRAPFEAHRRQIASAPATGTRGAVQQSSMHSTMHPGVHSRVKCKCVTRVANGSPSRKAAVEQRKRPLAGSQCHLPRPAPRERVERPSQRRFVDAAHASIEPAACRRADLTLTAKSRMDHGGLHRSFHACSRLRASASESPKRSRSRQQRRNVARSPCRPCSAGGVAAT